MPTQSPLQEAAAILRRAAPIEWERFLLEFENYASQAVMGMVDADKEHLRECQGMSRQCLALARLFKHCDT